MRIGVLYPDGSLNLMAPNEDGRMLVEAVKERDAWHRAGGGVAKVVSVDLDDGDIVELGPEDFK